ncbi:MAG: ssDNA-binding domain-containing protein [Saccharofermentans sp.]|nr:ssDNA-binding domain-containing protein [Saccharofermentans sp.]
MRREDATDQIKLSLASYLESQGINTSRNFRCLSVDHQDDHPSMSYKAVGNNGYPFVHCFACGATFDTISLIANDYGLTPYSRENFERAYSLFGLEVDGYDGKNSPVIPIKRVPQERKIPEPEEIGIYDFSEGIEAAHKAMLTNRVARQHFAARHYSADVVMRYKLGYIEKGHNELLNQIPDKHRCKSWKANLYQFIYPIIDENGKATYFMSEINDRDQCDDYNPKYRKINELPAPLFNERYIKKDTPPVIFITEGIPDALSVESVNGKAIALTGVGYNRLIELVNHYKPNTTLVLALDNDNRGKKMTEKLIEELDGIGCRYILGGPTFKKDFNEELIADPKRFVESVKKTIVDALIAPSPIRKEKETMAKNVTFRQIKSDEPKPETPQQAPHFKDKSKQMLVDMYLDSLKKDELPWQCGWKKLGAQRNMETGRKYRGMNALLLSFISEIRGYSDNRWMTFKQISDYREKNGITGPYFKNDAKGQSVPITYYGVKFYDPETKKYDKAITFEKAKELIESGEKKKEDMRIAVLGTYCMFNCSIVNGIEPPLALQQAPIEPSEYITAIINGMGVNYEEKGDRAYYRSRTDTVVLPPSSMFTSKQSYYATQLHELSHSTGHPTRLNRPLGNEFGSEAYALEELNAEIASSFLCADLGLEEVAHEFEETPGAALNHAAYVQNWIQVLENNPEALFKAISTAQKIEEYCFKVANIDPEKIRGTDPEEEPEVEDDIEVG